MQINILNSCAIKSVHLFINPIISNIDYERVDSIGIKMVLDEFAWN